MYHVALMFKMSHDLNLNHMYVLGFMEVASCD